MTNILLYALIGVVGVLVDLGLFNILYMHLDKNYYLLYHAAGYFLGTVISFYFNSKFNFKVTTKLKYRFAAFLLVSFIGLLTSTVFIYLVSYFMNLDPRFSKLLSLFVVFAVQYSLNKKFTFSNHS